MLPYLNALLGYGVIFGEVVVTWSTVANGCPLLLLVGVQSGIILTISWYQNEIVTFSFEYVSSYCCITVSYSYTAVLEYFAATPLVLMFHIHTQLS